MPELTANKKISSPPDAETKSALIQVARLKTMNQEWDQALQQYQTLADLFPSDPFILEPLARVQQKLGMQGIWTKTLAKALQCYKSLGMTRKAELLEARLFQVPPAAMG
jgi:hypothetical protein